MKIVLVLMMGMVFTNAFADVANGDCYRTEGEIVKQEGSQLVIYRCNKSTSTYERTVVKESAAISEELSD